MNINQYQNEIALFEPYIAHKPVLNPAVKEDIVDLLLAELEAVISQFGVTQANGYSQKRQLLRAALNALAPHTLSEKGTDHLNQLLQAELNESEPVAGDLLAQQPFFSINNTKVVLWRGDITSLKIDAIVNAANSQLLGCFQPLHECIDNAIHSKAGVQLRDDCNTIMQKQNTLEATGCAKVTRAYNLPAKFVIHTVGPIVQGELTKAHHQGLANSYQSCLQVCAQVEQIRSLAVCSISTGVFGYPIEEATDTAVTTVCEWLKSNPDQLEYIVFNVFSDRDYRCYQLFIEEMLCRI
ncbi:MAG: protein-ADP-ribose hydrolase [Moritella sp.]|uniref:protein-ADP-ribose hydrolase n=1 Tax=Moritella sp. TaxID=78556 RepID=UPI0029BC527B|nr:protein-ADP-ribose hydrolase [Moritella sp.]MDX2319700.1 protein-ADP-ribose hydrolase [Moritella sp.]